MQDSEQEATERSLERGARNSPGGNSDRGVPRTMLAFCNTAAGLTLIYRALDQTQKQGDVGSPDKRDVCHSGCHVGTSSGVNTRLVQLEIALL